MNSRPMSTAAIIAGVFLLGATSGMACLWIRGTTIEGKYTGGRSPKSKPEMLRECIATPPKKRLEEILRGFAPSQLEPEKLSDAAVELLLSGEVHKAVAKLEALEASHPGQYYTAANLGTAYELVGEDDKALAWIKEGIKRDPEAHMRTEWLHARILETKIRLKSDPDLLANSTITGIDFTRVKKGGYELATLQGDMHPTEVLMSLGAQLAVRMLFVKPEDPIVAQLLLELAKLEAELRFLEDATDYLKIAEEYGLPAAVSAPLKERWGALISRARWQDRAAEALKLAGFLALAIMVVLTTRFVVRCMRGLHDGGSTGAKAS